MRIALAALLLLASSARAEDRPFFSPLLGIGVSGSDSGLGLGAQAGVRLSSVLLRVTLEVGGGVSRRGYLLESFRAGYLVPVNDEFAVLAGAGVGGLVYGFIFDDPSATVGVIIPEVGIVFRPYRLFGRISLGAAAFIPTEGFPHPRDRMGVAVEPPHAMLTLLLSL